MRKFRNHENQNEIIQVRKVISLYHIYGSELGNFHTGL
ncbi:hypothetical protein LEP1GSC125_1368 [Leptospira mayottensis 200901122]|uniref:Uncharacterized protein n=1 Tax=Leptospira mayottensis 200901122 TaxID=1193010 RepID=A0AA87SWZ3_9LEPT|nr:hypothetical protein LEP1GSC125_1368 [Leptospira mayottensis 200901122]